MKTCFLCCLLILLSPIFFGLAHCAETTPFVNGCWIDLTQEYSSETIYWPTASGFVLEKEFYGATPKGYFYAANRYGASEHGGTHLDAPIHFAEGRKTIEQLPLDLFMGAAVVVDVSSKALKDPDYRIEVADLKAWESAHGRIPSGAIVLLRTGYARYWPDGKKYLGTAEKGQAGVDNLHFPGLHPDAARWLVSERAIKAVGLDTASIDYGQSKLFETHRVLCGNDVLPLENLTALDKLPPTGAYVIALPMKIKGGSGSPLRMIAWVPANPAK